MYSTALEILKEMVNLPNKFHLSKLNQTKISNLNRPKDPEKEKSLQICHQKDLRAMSLQVESYQTFQGGDNEDTPQSIQQY